MTWNVTFMSRRRFVIFYFKMFWPNYNLDLRSYGQLVLFLIKFKRMWYVCKCDMIFLFENLKDFVNVNHQFNIYPRNHDDSLPVEIEAAQVPTSKRKGRFNLYFRTSTITSTYSTYYLTKTVFTGKQIIHFSI
jgi:hypothetical protein